MVVVMVEGKLYPIEYRVPLAGTVPPPGDVWPKPRQASTTNDQLTLDRSRFQFESSLSSSCDIISKAFDRYKAILFVDSRATADSALPLLERVQVVVTTPTGSELNCKYPTADEDEWYRVEVFRAPNATSNNQGRIEARSVWGALRGLETFAQLVYTDDEYNSWKVKVNVTTITDWPRFKYRGVMLDTARHYLQKRTLLSNLDAMEANKFNTFHWHLVDDQSYPIVSKKFPTLHEKGAFTPKHIYTPEDVQEIIEYARLRGIRVIPELDTPGHTHAMARAYPQLLTPCYGPNGEPNQPNFPLYSESELLNPMENFTYDFLRDLFTEWRATFPDAYIHLGMDEAYYDCWKSNPQVGEFMQAHGMVEYSELEQYYVEKAIALVQELGYRYIVWQDPVDNGVTLASDSIVSVWKDTNLDSAMEPWQDYIERVAKKNYQIILSACWYLNYINYPYPGYDWEKYYFCDPHNFTGTDAEKALVIGGQANLWSEFVDSTNLMARFYPRASAVAERLWSDPAATQDVDTARHRLDAQRCKMLRRGLTSSPILNGYCGDWEVEQEFVDGPTPGSGASSRPIIGSILLLLVMMLLFLQ